MFFPSDGEAIETVVGFCPPAVEHGEIQSAIQHDFLAAGTGSFQRPPWIVEPDIDALHEIAADVDVVILNKNESIGESESRIISAICCSTRLPGSSCGCAFPAKTNCTGRLGSFTIAVKPGDICQHQVRTLIGCKPPREADGQASGLSTLRAAAGTREILHDAQPVRTRDAE